MLAILGVGIMEVVLILVVALIFAAVIGFVVVSTLSARGRDH
jgi:hypothetical protein